MFSTVTGSFWYGKTQQGMSRHPQKPVELYHVMIYQKRIQGTVRTVHIACIRVPSDLEKTCQFAILSHLTLHVQDDPAQEQQAQEYAVDQWIIEFANLFREHTGNLPCHWPYTCHASSGWFALRAVNSAHLGRLWLKATCTICFSHVLQQKSFAQPCE